MLRQLIPSHEWNEDLDIMKHYRFLINLRLNSSDITWLEALCEMKVPIYILLQDLKKELCLKKGQDKL